jgi:mycothiol synthase
MQTEFQIEKIDLRALPDEEIALLNAFSNAMRAESHPEDPPRPLEVAIASIRAIPDVIVMHNFLVRDADRNVIASAETGYLIAEENKHLMDGGISVLADYRRRGIATALLPKLVEVAEAENRTLMLGTTSERVPAGEAFARVLGAEPGLAQHINRLDLAEVDRTMIDKWVAEGPSRAEGYSLFMVDGAYPEEQLDAILDLVKVMNDAPRDDLDMEDFSWTAEHMRKFEESMTQSGEVRWTLFARHDASGRLVGYSEVYYNQKMPKTVYQGGTGVRPEDRGHALGKWLKAAMLQRVLDERTEAKDVRTGNADSNDAMLGINHQIGFRAYNATMTWQVQVSKLRAYVGG